VGEVRIAVRVKPGASRARVGGSFGPDGALIVSVNAAPVDGAANQAVIDAVSKAFGVRRRQVRLVSGQSARTKLLAIDVPQDDVTRLELRLAELLA
jgi:uncharacterized protein (TIGR00251 family)